LRKELLWFLWLGDIRFNIVKAGYEIMLLNQNGIKINEKEQEEFIWNGQN